MNDIPGFKIEKELGRGGMAKVYLAKEDGLERLVALKVMLNEVSEDDDFAKRFLREAQLAASLSHPHIVPIYAMRKENGQLFIAMEYLPGGDLKDLISKGITVKDTLTIMEKIISALHYAHSKGITHRDIKPDNIVFRESGEPVLTDFGIAKASDAATQLTATNMVMGTPTYMSPEQFESSNVTSASDIYGIGIVLFEMLTGHCPYESDSMVTAMKKHLLAPIPSLPQELILLQPLLDSLLAKSADDRDTADKVVAVIKGLQLSLPESILGYKPDVNSISDSSGLSAADFDPNDPTIMLNRTDDETIVLARTQKASNKNKAKSVVAVVSLLIVAVVMVYAWPFIFNGNGLNDAASVNIASTTVETPVSVAVVEDKTTAQPPSSDNNIVIVASKAAMDSPVTSKTVDAKTTDKVVEKVAKAIKKPAFKAIKKYALNVITTPKNAKVRLAKLDYSAGMLLPEGRYQLEVSASGYTSYKNDFLLSASTASPVINLQKSGSRKIVDTLRSGAKAPVMMHISAGNFLMGCLKCEANASPQHRVHIKKSYALSEREVSYAEYKLFADATGRKLSAESSSAIASTGDAEYDAWLKQREAEMAGFNGTAKAEKNVKEPITDISWEEAVAYTEWLSKETGQRYRLPSESEWEYAAVSGAAKDYPWGASFKPGLASCKDCSHSSLTAAASYKANAFGLYDMAGNVWEWTMDCKTPSYAKAKKDGSANLNGQCTQRMKRGGAWDSPAQHLKTTLRLAADKTKKFANTGIRLARDL